MIDLEQQLNLFSLLGNKLKNKINVFVIGGSAMMFLGSKLETKDVDLVVAEKEDFDILKEVLLEEGFKLKSKITIVKRNYEPRNKPIFLERGDIRFDLFLKEVICIKITENIKERVKEVHTFNNLIINVISPEDILLMKSTTERAGDRLDAVELIKKYDINWDIIVNESINQTKIGEHIFPVFLYDFLEELKEDLKVDIPVGVLKKLRKISKDEIIRHLKKNKSI